MVQGGEVLTSIPCIADDTVFAKNPGAGKPRKLSKEEEERHRKALSSFFKWLEEHEDAQR